MSIEEMEKVAHEEECADEKVKCEFCKDTGYITKTEWVGEDSSYDVEVKCFNCNE